MFELASSNFLRLSHNSCCLSISPSAGGFCSCRNSRLCWALGASLLSRTVRGAVGASPYRDFKYFCNSSASSYDLAVTYLPSPENSNVEGFFSSYFESYGVADVF